MLRGLNGYSHVSVQSRLFYPHLNPLPEGEGGKMPQGDLNGYKLITYKDYAHGIDQF